MSEYKEPNDRFDIIDQMARQENVAPFLEKRMSLIEQARLIQEFQEHVSKYISLVPSNSELDPKIAGVLEALDRLNKRLLEVNDLMKEIEDNPEVFEYLQRQAEKENEGKQ